MQGRLLCPGHLMIGSERQNRHIPRFHPFSDLKRVYVHPLLLLLRQLQPGNGAFMAIKAHLPLRFSQKAVQRLIGEMILVAVGQENSFQPRQIQLKHLFGKKPGLRRGIDQILSIDQQAGGTADHAVYIISYIRPRPQRPVRSPRSQKNKFKCRHNPFPPNSGFSDIPSGSSRISF